jgi:regulator of sirC expression with transglutaminase-like and TPR domain
MGDPGSGRSPGSEGSLGAGGRLVAGERQHSARVALVEAGRAGSGVLDLAACALNLAILDNPQRDPAAYGAHLQDLAATARALPVAQRARSAAQWLAETLAGLHGYIGDGDTYDDVANADLMTVIDRRRGLPVALAILYIHVARAHGWGMCGLAFPGHFLVRLDVGGSRLILDPFHGGVVVDAAGLRGLLKAVHGVSAELQPQHYAPVSDRTVLIRLRNNILARFMRAGQHEAAAEVMDSMLLLAPDDPTLWREVAVLQVKQGQFLQAMASLESLLALPVSPALRQEASVWLARLRDHLN